MGLKPKKIITKPHKIPIGIFYYICIMTKAEKTKLHIIQTVAPIFNKSGYAAMSLSKITAATGLTKGAIYGHFKNKEELAAEAYKHSVRTVLKDLNEHVQNGKTPLERLYKIPSFYENYYQYIKKAGGCPILNIGVDSEHQEHSISNIVQSYNNRMLDQYIKLIDQAKAVSEVKSTIDSSVYARRFFYMIEGAVYMSHIMKNDYYLKDVAVTIVKIIQDELKK